MPPLIARPQEEEDLDLRKLWATLWRHRWLIAVGLFVGVSAGVAAVVLIAPKYQAVASIRIDDGSTSSTVLDLLQTLSSGGTEIETEKEVLGSRTLVERTVDSLALEAQLVSPRHVSRTAVMQGMLVTDPLVTAVYDITSDSAGVFAVRDVSGDSAIKGTYRLGALVTLPGVAFHLTRAALAYPRLRLSVAPRADVVTAMMLKTLSVDQPDKDANVLTVTYTGPDSVLARAVPDVVTDFFIRQRQTDQKTQARSTVKFLTAQLDTLSIQLRTAEDALEVYREKENIVAPATEGGTELQYAVNLEAEQSSVSMELTALQNLMGKIHAEQNGPPRPANAPSPYRQLLGFPTILKSQAAGQLFAALATLENEKTALLTRRKEADPDVQMLNSRIHDMELQIGTLGDTYVQSLVQQKRSLDSTLTTIGAVLTSVPAKEIEYARLARQAKVYEDINTLLQTKLKEAQIAAAVDDASARMVDYANLPEKPISPNKPLVIVLAAFLGLLVAVATAFLHEFMDRGVHTRDELSAVTGVPVLGLIPHIQAPLTSQIVSRRLIHRLNPMKLLGGARHERQEVSSGAMTSSVHVHSTGAADLLEARLVSRNDPRNPVSEAYRGLRTNITFAQPDNPARTILFTSPMPGDGKSTSATNLAITMAQQGLKVLLVDADLRRGTLHSIFDTTRDPGLSNTLIGAATVSTAVRHIDLDLAEGAGGLDLLPTGTLPPNPAELLASARCTALVDTLASTYDIVIFDTPPMNLVTDAAVVGSAVDAVIVVARAGSTTGEALRYATEQLQNVRANIIGTVLNDMDFARDARYAGYYGRYKYYQYYYASSK